MTPIWVPEGDDSTTLESIVASIRRRLGDTERQHRQTETGDGTETAFPLDAWPASDLVVTVAAVATTDYVYADGWVVFDTAPAAAATIVFTYTSQVWSEIHITELVNDSVRELFGSFYVNGESTFTTTGAQEYTVLDADGSALPPEARLARVECWSAPHWVRIDRWSVRGASGKVLHFESAPASGMTMRVTYKTTAGRFSDADDTLDGTVGLPLAAREPIVLMAMASLLGDRLGVRLRSDMGHNTQNENQIKSYEIQNDAAWYRSQAEMKVRRLHMEPLPTRVVY